MLKKLLLSIITPALSIYITSLIMNGIYLTSLESLVVLSIVIGVLNTFLKPLLKLLTFPINVLSFGIFSFVLNGIVLLISFTISPGVHIANLGTSIIASVVISLINTFINRILL